MVMVVGEYRRLERKFQEGQEAIIPQDGLMYLIGLSRLFGYDVEIGDNELKFIAQVYINPLGGKKNKEVGKVDIKKSGLVLKIEENNDLVGNPMLPYYLSLAENKQVLNAVLGLK